MTTTPTTVVHADGTNDNQKEEKENACCCPKFDRTRFDEKEFVWKDKPFVKDSTLCFFYMPLNFGGMMRRACAKIESANASCGTDEFLMLADMNSKWITRVCLSVEKDEIPGAEVVKISGTFLAKVFEGPYSNFSSWIKEMEQFIKTTKDNDFDVKCSDMYAHYATCPGCAKKYGENYTVIFAKVS